MREIKFRAWDKKNKRMAEPLDLDTLVQVASKGTLETGLAPTIKGFEYMQYTGLKDKNGVEIYEGDIMRVRLNYQYRKTTPIDKQRRRKYIVGYRCGIHQQYTTAEYQLHILSEYFDNIGGYCGLSDIDMRDSEVIGNIHEHPELLK